MRRRSLPWLVPSIILHGAAGLALAPAPRREAPFAPFTVELAVAPHEDAVRGDDAVAAFELDRSLKAEPLPTDPRHVAPSSVVVDRVLARRAPAPSRRANEDDRAVASRAAEEERAVALRADEEARAVASRADEEAETTTQQPSPPRALDLSPRAAARTLIEPRERPTPSAEERLNRAIAEGAMRKQPLPAEPELHPRPEGGYAYMGHGFSAVIESNGDVRMTDRFGSVHIPLVPFQTPDGQWHIALLGGTFRLFEWLDKKLGKNDPYRSERRWFLERTRALRERLAREHAPRPLHR